MPHSKPAAAVLVFPGSNCDLETVQALERNGFAAEIVRWNEPKKLQGKDALVIVGGFSYEDRGRSGLIASRDPIMQEIGKMAARGVLVLGICNGAQILVESGLVPQGKMGESTVALARNVRAREGEVLGTGFYNAWVYMRSIADTAFGNREDAPMRVPVAHGEGRFITDTAKVLEDIVANTQNAYVYCTADGEILPSFPTNPNGSMLNLAGLTNPAGTVMALMPHPERVTAGDSVFAAMYAWIVGKTRVKQGTLPARGGKMRILKKPTYDVEGYISLKITDNEAVTVGQAIQRAGIVCEVRKYRWVGVHFRKKMSRAKQLACLLQMTQSGLLCTTEKELMTWVLGGEEYRYVQGKLVAVSASLPKVQVLVRERGTLADAAALRSLNAVCGALLGQVTMGMAWGTDGKKAELSAAVEQCFFHHPAASDVYH